MPVMQKVARLIVKHFPKLASMTQPLPDKILQLGLSFWSSKTFLSAIELGLFTELAAGGKDALHLQQKLGLHPRSARDFLDALVALGMLNRRDGIYSNTAEADLYLDRSKPTYIGGVLEMANSRLYPCWGKLTEALRTGEPQNEVKKDGSTFEALYSDPARLRQFLSAMTGLSRGIGRMLALKFSWEDYRTFVDVGAAQGAVAVQIAMQHPHLTGGGFDLPPVGPIFEQYVESFGLAERLSFYPGNFFSDPLPQADVLIMGHILHDWNLDEKRCIISNAYQALPAGGALLVFDTIIDDERRRNVFGLLMSLNMLIETQGGFDYTGRECISWLREAGFSETKIEPLAGPDSVAIGIK